MLPVPTDSFYNTSIFSAIRPLWFNFLRTTLSEQSAAISDLEEYYRRVRRAFHQDPRTLFLTKDPVFLTVRKYVVDDYFKRACTMLDKHYALPSGTIGVKGDVTFLEDVSFVLKRQDRASHMLESISTHVDKLLRIAADIERVDENISALPKPVDETKLNALVDRAKKLEDDTADEIAAIKNLLSDFKKSMRRA